MRTYRMTVELEVKFEGLYENMSPTRAKEKVEREIASYIPTFGMEFTEVEVKKNEAVVTQ